jgi:hypothetical protein
MKTRIHTLLALAGAVLLVAGTAQLTTTHVSAAAQATAAPKKMVPPIRGEALLGVTKPVTVPKKIDGKEFIVTTMKVKNMSSGSIAGFKADEFWLDKAGNPVGGDTFRNRKPMLPDEVLTLEFTTPRDPRMSSNQYQFSHANGTIKTQLVPKL